jgi:hypothetical protein
MSLIAHHYQEARDLIIIEATSFEDFLQKRTDNFISVSYAKNPPEFNWLDGLMAKSTGSSRKNVCYWHLAEVSCPPRPIYGTKRTSASAAPMSQNDPKRKFEVQLLSAVALNL